MRVRFRNPITAPGCPGTDGLDAGAKHIDFQREHFIFRSLNQLPLPAFPRSSSHSTHIRPVSADQKTGISYAFVSVIRMGYSLESAVRRAPEKNKEREKKTTAWRVTGKSQRGNTNADGRAYNLSGKYCLPEYQPSRRIRYRKNNFRNFHACHPYVGR